MKTGRLIPFSAANEPTHAIRYVIAPDGLAYVTLLSTGRKFVVQAPYFRNVLDIHPRTTLGAVSVTGPQLAALGFITGKEVSAHDRLLSAVSSAI